MFNNIPYSAEDVTLVSFKHCRIFAPISQQLRTAFENEARVSGSARLLLTAAVPAGKNTIDVGYDVPALTR